MGTTESRQAWPTSKRDASTGGFHPMRHSAGTRSESAQSARGRAALLKQGAIVTPTPARLTPVARASSTLLLKTASCTRARLKVRACQFPKYIGPGRQRATHPRSTHRDPLLGNHLARRLRRVRLPGTPGNLAKNRDILTPKTIGTTHRMHEENGQYQTLKHATFPRQMGLFAAAVAALEGSHSGPLADRLDTASARLHALVITHL